MVAWVQDGRVKCCLISTSMKAFWASKMPRPQGPRGKEGQEALLAIFTLGKPKIVVIVLCTYCTVSSVDLPQSFHSFDINDPLNARGIK